jgi:hypothetical protein
MSAARPDRVAVLVIRVWVEAGSQPRARITASLDIVAQATTTTTVTASSVDELCTIVRDLVTDFLAS